MNDDLAAEAASWVPPWQRPAPAAHPPGPPEPEDPDSVTGPQAETGEIEPDDDSDVRGDESLREGEVAAGAPGDGEVAVQASGEGGPAGWDMTPGVAAPTAPDSPSNLDTSATPVSVVPEQRAAEQLPALAESELTPALEAILMVVDEPVNEITLAQVLDVPAEQVANALIDLCAAYTREGRGFDLRRAAGGWRIYTRADYSSYVEKFVLDGQQMRLTQASLETLAVVAYRQPVTRSRISAIRGVNCDGVIRTLITRGMIEECGTDPDSGAHLYRTTTLFLEKLGLDSVEQLPPLAPFLPDNLDEVAAGG